MRFKSPKGRWKWLILAAPFAAIVIAAKLFNTSPPTNRAQTAPDAAPPLRTRLYALDLNRTFDAAREVVQHQTTWGQDWRIVNTARDETNLAARHLDVEVPVIFFTDDLTVTLRAQGDQTRVDVDSMSRVGKGDWGENRRHVVQFLSALDEKLKR